MLRGGASLWKERGGSSERQKHVSEGLDSLLVYAEGSLAPERGEDLLRATQQMRFGLQREPDVMVLCSLAHMLGSFALSLWRRVWGGGLGEGSDWSRGGSPELVLSSQPRPAGQA